MHTLRATARQTKTATLLTTIEPTSSLHPAPPTARRLDLARGHGVSFADETVLLADDEGTIGGADLQTDWAGAGIRAVIVTRDGRITV